MIELVGALYGSWSSSLDNSSAHRLARTITLLKYSFATGCILGAIRGTRRASLQFLAEHHHTPPRTKSAVFAYIRQRNARTMLAAGKEGFKLGGRLAGMAAIFAGGRWMVGEWYGEVWWEEIAAGWLTGSLLAVAGRKQFMYNFKKGTLLGVGLGSMLSILRYCNENFLVGKQS